MKKGKFSRKACRMNPRFVAMLVSVVVVCSVAIGVTLAYLSTVTTGLTNVFNPSQVTSKVVETFDDGPTKSNVKIQNTGDISAFIRADIVVTWKAENGNVLSEVPEEGADKDYTFDPGEGWFTDGSGFYYWPSVVAADDNDDQTSADMTGNLIDSATALKTKTVGETTYYVSIEIICSAIQADGVDADGDHPVELAWGVTYNDSTKTISAKQGG